ncbi:MAG TPA: thermonuclease family protein [Mycobacterium sp.]
MTMTTTPKNSVAQRLRVAALHLGAVCALTAGLSSCAHAGPPVADAAPAPTTATVLRTVDGDTIDVRDDTRGRLRVRLLGIDTPEVHKPGWSVGCWGPEAARFAAETLTGQRVSLVADPTADAHDRYGRSLAYVELADGRDYSVEAARAGMARSYVYDDKPVSRYPEIEAAEQEARTALRGLWGSPCNGHTESTRN